MSELDELADAATRPAPRLRQWQNSATTRPPVQTEMKVPTLLWVLAWISACGSGLYIVNQIYVAVKVDEIRTRLENAAPDPSKKEKVFKSDVERLHDKNVFQQ